MIILQWKSLIETGNRTRNLALTSHRRYPLSHAADSWAVKWLKLNSSQRGNIQIWLILASAQSAATVTHLLRLRWEEAEPKCGYAWSPERAAANAATDYAGNSDTTYLRLISPLFFFSTPASDLAPWRILIIASLCSCVESNQNRISTFFLTFKAEHFNQMFICLFELIKS